MNISNAIAYAIFTLTVVVLANNAFLTGYFMQISFISEISFLVK